MTLVPTAGGITTTVLLMILASRLPGNLLGEAPLIVSLVSLLAGLMTYISFSQALART